MLRILIFAILILTFITPICLAQPGKIITGEMNVVVIEEGKKDSEDVKFTIHGDQARLDTKASIYYIVELDTEIAYLVNPRRKTVSIMYARNILNHTLPPLFILKDKAGLKRYLSNANGKLESIVNEDSVKYEVWAFSIGPESYKVKIKLPEYFPAQVTISSKNLRTIVNVKDKNISTDTTLPVKFFCIPDSFDVVDLMSN
jgi:hypothetical protein